MKVRKNLQQSPEEETSGIKREPGGSELTPGDEEKRRRRRERNKIAAEKCRNKRKKEIEKLFSESDVVAVQNAQYKEEISRLQAEHQELLAVLEQHRPVCRRHRPDQAAASCIAKTEPVKTEEDVDLLLERDEKSADLLYRYTGDLLDSTATFNFPYSGYYDTACFAN